MLEVSGEGLEVSGVTVGWESGKEDGLVEMLLSEGLWAGLCWVGRVEELESVRGLIEGAALLCGPCEDGCSSPTGGQRIDGVE